MNRRKIVTCELVAVAVTVVVWYILIYIIASLTP